ncbi:MAG: LPXTG cell wall anchor domain-containing protein [Aquimonas sp.]|nr:LPXTG cell wall anchor domain-containing protein [Aquimonas sp.]
MNRSIATRFTLSLLAFAIAGSAAAQQPPSGFPDQRESPRTCEDFKWSADMTSAHPRVVDACQEAVFAGGEHWARLSARFVRTASDGRVVFSIQDRNDRVIEEVTLQTAPGQVAYINDRATPFANLRTSDSINLYVPEGRYGYATQAGAPREQIAVLVPQEQARTELAAVPPRTASAAPQGGIADRLPATAGQTYWLGLAGLLSLLGALGLTLVRRQ